jgi:hypothetical protein
MGVNCRAYLPPNVAVDKVADVIGAAAGCPVERYALDSNRERRGRMCTRVRDVKVITTSVPTMVSIVVERATVDGEKSHFTYYHFEGEGGLRTMMPPSTAFWIAVMTRVVDFFGGRLTYQDCEGGVDYEVSFKSDSENWAEDGDEFYSLQDRIAAVRPITEEEWRSFDEHAAYKIEDR